MITLTIEQGWKKSFNHWLFGFEKNNSGWSIRFGPIYYIKTITAEFTNPWDYQ